MSGKIDHAAEAVICIGAAHKGTNDDRIFTMMQAQVHATLALVEQQRIANLLTYAQFDHQAENGKRLFTTFDGAMDIRIQTAVALGIISEEEAAA